MNNCVSSFGIAWLWVQGVSLQIFMYMCITNSEPNLAFVHLKQTTNDLAVFSSEHLVTIPVANNL